MSDTKFTPGPWNWVSKAHCYVLEGQGEGYVHTDGSAFGEYGPDIDVNGPDAHLIAAAPALYAALEELLRVDDEWHGSVNSEMSSARHSARVALRKARGEAA